MRGGDNAYAFDGEGLRLGIVFSYKMLVLGLDTVELLMFPCGEKGEAGIFERKTGGALLFVDATFAKEDNLITSKEEVSDNGPFFKGDFEHEWCLRCIRLSVLGRYNQVNQGFLPVKRSHLKYTTFSLL